MYLMHQVFTKIKLQKTKPFIKRKLNRSVLNWTVCVAGWKM